MFFEDFSKISCDATQSIYYSKEYFQIVVAYICLFCVRSRLEGARSKGTTIQFQIVEFQIKILSGSFILQIN